MSFTDALTRTVRYTPEFEDSPGLAVTAAQTGDPQNGEAIAHVANQGNLANAYDTVAKHHGGHNILGEAFHWLGGAAHHVIADVAQTVGHGLHLLNAPLAEVQHQYRYVHDVYARHGPLAALLEGIGIAGGAALGSVIAPGEGTVLGGEAAAGLLGRLTFGDSWQRTANGEKYRDPTSNRPVSLGRDVASILGLKPSSKPFGIVSGLSDFIGDLGLDPLAQGANLLHAPASPEGLRVAGNTIGGTAIDIANPNDVDRVVRQVPAVARAMQNIAGLDAGQIVTRYPQLAPIAQHLGAADTADKVIGVFKDQAAVNEMLSNTLPTRTFTQAAQDALATRVTNYTGPGAAHVRRATSFLPYTLDEAGRVSHDIDPASNTAFKAVYDTYRFAFPRRVAETMTSEYVNAGPAERMLIYRNGIMKVITELGLPEELQAGVKRELEEATGGVGAGKTDVYGRAVDGRDLSQVFDDQGMSHTAAIFRNQTGKMAIPKWELVNDEIRNLSTASRYYGAADDWMYRNFTSKVFKPLALATGGFALRMAAAEALPEVLRNGFWNYTKSLAASTAAKLGVDMAPEEAEHVAAATADAVGGPRKLLQLAKNNSSKLQVANDLQLMNGGHITSPTVNATHGYSEMLMSGPEKAERSVFSAVQSTPMRMREGSNFEWIGNGEQRFTKAWQSALTEPARDPAGQAAAQALLNGTDAPAAVKNVLDNMAPAELDLFKRHLVGSDPSLDPHEDWANVVVEAVKGLTHSPDGVANPDLLNAIADGKVLDTKILDQIPRESRPVEVKGRELVPSTLPSRITDRVFNGLGAVINSLSREPIYVSAVDRQYKTLAGAVDDGLMSHWEAMDLAQKRASNEMLRFIHNPAERTQLAVTLRNAAPFYFAQQQAYARFGRLLADDPAAFRRMQLAVTALVDAGHEAKDGNGNSFLNYPGAGFLTNGSAELLKKLGVPLIGSIPMAMSGDVKSLNTVIPFAEGVRPSFGPMVTIPMRVVTNLFPEAEPLSHDLLGDRAASASIWQQLVPNTFAYRTIQAFGNEHRRSFASSMMATIQTLAFQQEQAMDRWVKAGHKPDDPGAPAIIPTANAGPIEQQRFVDRVKNQTRVNFLAKAIFGLVAPASPQINIGDMSLPDELRQLMKDHGLSAGTQMFLDKHPDATPYTVFQSKNLGDAPLPATRPAQDFYDTHSDFLAKYPYAGAWLLPQTGTFDQGVYNEQLAQHLRVKKAPDQFLKDIYTASGNHQFFEVDKPNFDRQLADLKAKGDKEGARVLRANFNAYLAQRGLSNPVWWDDFQSADRDTARKLAVDDMAKMVSDPALPRSGMGEELKALLAQYQRFQQSLIKGRIDTEARDVNKLRKQNWQAYLAQTAEQTPELKPVIRKLFLTLSEADPNAKTAISRVFAS